MKKLLLLIFVLSSNLGMAEVLFSGKVDEDISWLVCPLKDSSGQTVREFPSLRCQSFVSTTFAPTIIVDSEVVDINSTETSDALINELDQELTEESVTTQLANHLETTIDVIQAAIEDLLANGNNVSALSITSMLK